MTLTLGAQMLDDAGHSAALAADLRWVSERLDLFTDHVTRSGQRARVKPIGELSMAFSYICRWWERGERITGPAPWTEVPGHLAHWRGFLSEFCASDVVAALIREQPQNSLYFLQPYLWLRTTGHRDDRCEDMLRQAWRNGQRPTSAGLLHVLHVAGLIRGLPDWSGLCRSSFLTRSLSEDDLNRDAYRLTHAVFYATELGGADPALEADEQVALIELVRTVADRSRGAGRWDLLVEALLSLLCLRSGEHTDGREHESLEALRSARRPDGGLPKDREVGQRPPSSTRHAFTDCYHATLADLLYRTRRQTLLQEATTFTPYGDITSRSAS